MLSEALLLLPSAVLHNAVQKKAVALLLDGRYVNYGYGVKSGARQLVMEAQADMLAKPERAVVQTDVRNAFGETRRDRALQEDANEIADVFLAAGREAGYTSFREQVIPELVSFCTDKAGKKVVHEAILDVELLGNARALPMLLDVTVRHAAIDSIIARSSVEDGVAILEGRRDKARRYPPRLGKRVICCAVETWGRVGNEVSEVLLHLDALAKRRQLERGVAPTRWRQRWGALLSAAVAQGIARAIIQAGCCLVYEPQNDKMGLGLKEDAPC